MLRNLALISLLIVLGHVLLPGQVSEQMLQQQLLERGIDEADFREKLRERGVMYQSIDEVPPEEYADIDVIVQEILAELEREKLNAEQAQQLENPELQDPSKLPEPVLEAKESIIEGASIEEAVAEAVEEQQPDLPPAKIYGQDIFRDQTLKIFRQADNIKPRDNYRLGPGDELTISIFGTSIFERTYTIDENGYINPAAMPRIYLRDLTFESAKTKLRRNFASFNRFNRDEFEVSLRFARTITIGLFGEVFHPGSHTISAINTAFNALVAGGGPTDIGTLRNIKWIRSDGDVQKIDVYSFMIDPTIGDDFYLSDNDIIQVPIAERIVSISGAVNRPMRYELVAGENLQKLIEYAGSFRPDAYREIIQLKRFENDQQVVHDIRYNQLSAQSSDFTLKNGDQITVRTIPTPYKNFVTISGSVELPGEYEFEQGMLISDLISKAVLTDESERTFAVIRRTNRDGTSNFVRVNLGLILNNASTNENLPLSPGDQLEIFSKSIFIDSYDISISGEVRNPGTFAFDPSQNMRVRDVILMSGGLTASAVDYAYIMRKSLGTDEPRYIKIDIREAVENPGSDQNIVLEPKDVIQIQSQASFIEGASISINGAVRNPGAYEFDESMSIRDLITLANGFRIDAATDRVEISRMVIDQNEPTQVVIATLNIDDNYEPIGQPDFQLQPYDQVMVRTVPEFEFQQIVNISGEVRYPGPYTITSDNERISNIIRRAGGLTHEAFPEGATLSRSYDATGPIVIELEEVMANENQDANIIVRHGDQIVVPKIKDFVAVGGAVNTTRLFRQDLLGPDNSITVIYDGPKSARYYIEHFAGGLSDNADRRKVTVEYPNGTIRETKDYGLFMVYPKVEKGSIVKVGTKTVKADKPEPEKEPIDWGEVLANAVGQATAVLTLILLIDRAGR